MPADRRRGSSSSQGRRRRRLVVPQHLQRSHPVLRKERRVDDTARSLLAELANTAGRPDLSGQVLVDVGCGVKFTRAIVNHDLSIGRYVGLDVDAEVIDFLQREVQDRRFSFHRINIHNERYNPTGKVLDDTSSLPIDDVSSDLVTGYSLFTHLAPDDFFHMARMMREHALPRTRLVITLYLDATSRDGYGFVDRFSASVGKSMLGMSKGGHVDVFEDDPLRVALYDERYARELLGRAGWRIDEIRDPTPIAQHTIVASPV